MLVNRVPNIDQAVISVHCHNDLGLAVANSLAAVENGAGQIECTINGLGERAGNCSMEEAVMALRTRSDYYQVQTGINTERLVPSSRLVSNITGMLVQRNKAIVGRNAFAHESGIHQDGMLKEPTTYEIMRPEDVGFTKTDLVLGKHSGRAALADRSRALGYHLSEEQLEAVYDDFKTLADKKKEIYDGDIAALIEQRNTQIGDQWQFVSYEFRPPMARPPQAEIVTFARRRRISPSMTTGGDGPLDALFHAIERLPANRLSSRISACRASPAAKMPKGESTIEVEHKGRVYRGRGFDRHRRGRHAAFVNAINRAAAGGGQPVDAERRDAV